MGGGEFILALRGPALSFGICLDGAPPATYRKHRLYISLMVLRNEQLINIVATTE